MVFVVGRVTFDSQIHMCVCVCVCVFQNPLPAFPVCKIFRIAMKFLCTVVQNSPHLVVCPKFPVFLVC